MYIKNNKINFEELDLLSQKDEDEYLNELENGHIEKMNFNSSMPGIFPFKMPSVIDHITINAPVEFLDRNFKCKKLTMYTEFSEDINEYIKKINMDTLDIRDLTIKDKGIREAKCTTLKMDIDSYTSSGIYIPKTVKKVHLAIYDFNDEPDPLKHLEDKIFRSIEVNLEFYITNHKGISPEYIDSIIAKYNIHSIKYIFETYLDLNYINPKIKRVSYNVRFTEPTVLKKLLDISRNIDYTKFGLSLTSILGIEDTPLKADIFDTLMDIAVKTPIFKIYFGGVPYFAADIYRLFNDKIRYSVEAEYFKCRPLYKFNKNDYQMLINIPTKIKKIRITYKSDPLFSGKNHYINTSDYSCSVTRKTVTKISHITKNVNYFKDNLKMSLGQEFSDVVLGI